MAALNELRGKTAVVTGGASGVGKGIAQCLIAAGMQVFIADIEAQELGRTAAQIGATGIHTDVSDFQSVQSLAERVRAQAGAVHVICNNAGVGALGRISDLSLEDWRWMRDVNLWGVIHGVHAFLPLLRANADGGHIVNTASIGGLVTMPGLGAYAASKYAVVALSETLAQELAAEGARIGVTVLCPGPTRTNIKASTRNRPAALAGSSGLARLRRDSRPSWPPRLVDRCRYCLYIRISQGERDHHDHTPRVSRNECLRRELRSGGG